MSLFNRPGSGRSASAAAHPRLRLDEASIRTTARMDAGKGHPPLGWQGVRWPEDRDPRGPRQPELVEVSEQEKRIADAAEQVVLEEARAFQQRNNDVFHGLDQLLPALRAKLNEYENTLDNLRLHWPDAHPEAPARWTSTLFTTLLIVVLSLVDWYINTRSFHYLKRPPLEIWLISGAIGVAVPLAGHYMGKHAKKRVKRLFDWFIILGSLPLAALFIWFLSLARSQSFQELGLSSTASSISVWLFLLVNVAILAISVAIGHTTAPRDPELQTLCKDLDALRTRFHRQVAALRDSVAAAHDGLARALHAAETLQLVYQDENRQARQDGIPAYFGRQEMLPVELPPDLRCFHERGNAFQEYRGYLEAAGDRRLAEGEELVKRFVEIAEVRA